VDVTEYHKQYLEWELGEETGPPGNNIRKGLPRGSKEGVEMDWYFIADSCISYVTLFVFM
jgi:hypothetical protein